MRSHQIVPGAWASRIKKSNLISYILVLDLDETLVHYEETETEGRVNFRPYLDYFLTEMAKHYEIVIFTAAMQEYADPILNHLDPDNKIILKRLYRQHTESIDNLYNLKDLSILNGDLRKTIIIDNIPENFTKQRANGIYIKSWYSDPKDTALKDLVPVLKDIVKSKTCDVRVYLKNFKQRLIDNIEKGSLHPTMHI